MLLAALLKSIVKVGTLKLIDAHGRTHNFDSVEGPSITIRLHERSLHTRLFFNPMLAVGEAFVDGTLTIEDGGTSTISSTFAGVTWARPTVTGCKKALPLCGG